MKRLRWIDLLRSLAIFGMIVYHTAFDLETYWEWDLDVRSGPWKLFQIVVASLFLAISGVSAGFWTLYDDAQWKGIRRGFMILSAALLVSLATATVDSETWVRFGILHLIAFAAFLLPLLRKLHPALIALLGIVCIALVPFDLMPALPSVDYVPPVPWLGTVLLGFAIGKIVASRTWALAKPSRLLDLLAAPGRHSLLIYLIHQPVILGVLWLVL